MLFVFMMLVGAVLTAIAFQSTGGDALAVVGVGAAAVSAYLLAWWSARYWYSAFCEGRRPEPVPEPNPWPWVPPPLIVAVAAAVSGVRALSRGDSSGWFSIGLAVVFGLPGLMGLVVAVLLVFSRSGTDDASAASARTTEPPRPRRDWGPIG